MLGETKGRRGKSRWPVLIRFKVSSGSLQVSPPAQVLGPHRQMGTQDQGQRHVQVWVALGILLSRTLSVGWGVESGTVTLMPGQDSHQVALTVAYPSRVTSSDQKARTESS